MYTVHCRVMVDNMCEFQHSFPVDGRLVNETRKDQTVNSEIRQNDLRSPTHVHILQRVNCFNSSAFANGFLSNQSGASTLTTASRSIHSEHHSLVFEHSQVLRYHAYLLSLQLRHRAVVGSFNSSPKSEESMFTRFLVAHCLLLFFSLPSWSNREKCSTLPPFQW